MMVDHLVASGESILALTWRTFSAGLSVWHRNALATLLPAQPGCLVKRLVIAQRRITDARELVGQRGCLHGQQPMRRIRSIHSSRLRSNAIPCEAVNRLQDSPVHRIPPSDHTGVPFHFHSSNTSGAASWISCRMRPSACPRQSFRSVMCWSISTDAGGPSGVFAVLMGASWSVKVASTASNRCRVRAAAG